ncbi:hypothetical protein ACI2L1_12025 [Streptomyces sp. NPDC019531]|uniref:hypothetical protein n=1 Tax=Streptomyces sp. NPDC019531 TaxID=3365062 RepID=UPI0038504075
MTTLTTKAGFNAFRDRMCEYFATLPEPSQKKPLHIEQADLGPDAFFTHRLDDDGHHIVYDPRQTSGLMVRQFLGIYADFSEHPILEAVREKYYDAEDDNVRAMWGQIHYEIDRAQDPQGVMDQIVGLISRKCAEKTGVSA